MRNLALATLMLACPLAYSDTELVPLNMELGYWETSTEILESEAMQKMLASVPEAHREQARAMMKSQTTIPVTKQCITAESFNHFEDKFKQAMGGQSDCRFDITKSTSQEFSGVLHCGEFVTKVHTKAINSKRQETEAVSTAGELGQTRMRGVTVWKSATCPAGL